MQPGVIVQASQISPFTGDILSTGSSQSYPPTSVQATPHPTNPLAPITYTFSFTLPAQLFVSLNVSLMNNYTLSSVPVSTPAFVMKPSLTSPVTLSRTNAFSQTRSPIVISYAGADQDVVIPTMACRFDGITVVPVVYPVQPWILDPIPINPTYAKICILPAFPPTANSASVEFSFDKLFWSPATTINLHCTAARGASFLSFYSITFPLLLYLPSQHCHLL